MEEIKESKIHKIIWDNRENGLLTGVLDVYAFDEDMISLMTEGGKLQVKGEKLHVKSLDLEQGQIEINGKVNSLAYLTKRAKKKNESFLKQFFR